ncbi:MAG: DNA internalization-related competence protein ComEC/Rec2 [Zetaproteobacteria bacterium CG1_02_53_45]|nr:MAG: DNA internalization-related competence protein ComEC/Rec2 [Zetaproteobacteria bacterium CG1_02_53_45]
MEENVFDLRRLPLFWPAGVWIAGLALVRTDLVAPFAALMVLASLLGLLVFLRKRVLAAVLVVAALWGGGDLLLDARSVAVGNDWLSGNVHITATVEKVEKTGASSRLLLSSVVRDDGQAISGKALLYSYGRQEQKVVAGQAIEATAHWRLPRNYGNPGSFDYKAWCFDHQIALIGSARGEIGVIETSVPWLESARQRIRAAISFADREEQGILSALLLAERSRVSQAVNRAFSATGTAHLLAISGMHVGLAAAWMFSLLWWLLTRREAWIVRLPVRSVALAGGFIAAAFYATVAGWPIPAMRAACMLAAAVLAWQLASRHEPLNILLAALGLMLLIDPAAVVSLSLWLSFSATAALLFWGLRSADAADLLWTERLRRSLRLLLWSSLLAMLVTLPMIVNTFGSLPVYGLPANLLLVPQFGLLVLPLALLGELAAVLGVESLAAVLMQISGAGAGFAVKIIDAMAHLPAGSLIAVVPPLWLSLLYGGGLTAAGWLWWQRRRGLASATVMLLLAAYLAAVLHESDVAEPTWVVWDVGQGAASTLLLPDNMVMVVDVPGHAGSRFNGGTIVAEGLRSMGLTHADVLLLSHAQSDHLGGALALMTRLNHLGEIWLPDVPSARNHPVPRKIAASTAVRIRWLARGDSVVNAQFEAVVLWPPRGFAPKNYNNASLVLTLKTASGKNLLLPGDIEAEVEEALLHDIGVVDAMLVPHHGSRSSSTPLFVQQLHPQLAIAQTGGGNRYGFPDGRVVTAYQEQGAVVKNSANGAVIVNLAAADMNRGLKQWQAPGQSRRQLAQHWWGATVPD